MAEEREPPPLENEPDLFGEDDDDDDIFKSALSQPKIEVNTESVAELDPEPAAQLDPEPAAELSAHVDAEVDENIIDAKPSETVTVTEESKEDSAKPVEPTTLDLSAPSNDADDGDDLFATPSSDLPVKKETVPSSSLTLNGEKPSADMLTPEEEAEAKDQFNIEISVNNPSKVGDGMNAYMVYQVNTVTSIPAFQKSQFSVKRRFSDFLGLHEKLVHKHRVNGVIVPKPPEKSAMGMAKVKMSKEESGSQDFIEKRRAALERYMNRIVAHSTLRMDPDVRDFLTMDTDLPKASGTSALSAAGVMRLFGKVGDAVTKLSANMTETDQWFDDKIQQIENFEIQLRKLHESSETLVIKRHTCSQSTSSLAKALAVVAGGDEHTNLSQVMTKLSQVEESIQQITEEQADSDFFTFSELLKDYLSQISAVKEVFGERIKIYKSWKDAEAALTKKREAKVKLELAHKTDKLPQIQAECKEWEEKVEKGEKDFKKISDALKKEVAQFDKKRCKDFKANLVNYLERLLNNEEQLISHWEKFLPEATAIA